MAALLSQVFLRPLHEHSSSGLDPAQVEPEETLPIAMLWKETSSIVSTEGVAGGIRLQAEMAGCFVSIFDPGGRQLGVPQSPLKGGPN